MEDYKFVYTGKLDERCEQGCGCSFEMQDYRGMRRNPKWPKETPENFYSYDWIIRYDNSMHMLIYDNDGVILFNDVIYKDLAQCRQYQRNFIPLGVDIMDWSHWHRKEYNAEIRSHKRARFSDITLAQDFVAVASKLIHNGNRYRFFHDLD